METNQTARFRDFFDTFRSFKRPNGSGEEITGGPVTSRLKRFLSEFAVASSKSGRSKAQQSARFRIFFEQFETWHRSAVEREQLVARNLHFRFRGFFGEFVTAVAHWEKRQAAAPERFNALAVLGVMRNEEVHSRILAWLLDRSYRGYGTHCQGSLGLRLFLSELKLDLTMAEEPYRTCREVAGADSRIDVEVLAPGHFLIHIEVKVDASEGTEQTNREWKDLLERATDFEIAKDKIIALYLTPTGRVPLNPNFRRVRWQQLVRVLHRFAEQSEAAEVKLFASHYARLLSRHRTIFGND